MGCMFHRTARPLTSMCCTLRSWPSACCTMQQPPVSSCTMHALGPWRTTRPALWRPSGRVLLRLLQHNRHDLRLEHQTHCPLQSRDAARVSVPAYAAPLQTGMSCRRSSMRLCSGRHGHVWRRCAVGARLQGRSPCWLPCSTARASSSAQPPEAAHHNGVSGALRWCLLLVKFAVRFVHVTGQNL